MSAVHISSYSRISYHFYHRIRAQEDQSESARKLHAPRPRPRRRAASAVGRARRIKQSKQPCSTDRSRQVGAAAPTAATIANRLKCGSRHQYCLKGSRRLVTCHMLLGHKDACPVWWRVAGDDMTVQANSECDSLGTSTAIHEHRDTRAHTHTHTERACKCPRPSLQANP